MQYTQAWQIVQQHHQQQQQQQKLQQPPIGSYNQNAVTSCFMASPKLMSPYVDYHQNQHHLQNRATTTQLFQPEEVAPLSSSSKFNCNNYSSNKAGGSYLQHHEQQNMGFNYVYSNSGKTFEYGLQSNDQQQQYQQKQQQRHRQEAFSAMTTTTTTHDINIRMNRATYLNDLEIIKRDYFFTMVTTMRGGGYCGALQRLPPPMPAAISRRLVNRGNGNYSKIKVMLRMTDNNAAVGAAGSGGGPENKFINIDQKKRQITFLEPSTSAAPLSTSTPGSSSGENANTASTSVAAVLDRAPMVSAPKIFAFDGLFTTDDPQSDVCTATLQDVIPAVLDGIDGCVLALGHPKSGQSRSMFGSMTSAGELGIIPCAISWLYKGIAEHRDKFGSRFSVRMSALAVNATKATAKAHDLLASMASESDDSPGMYFNVSGPVELRAPTMERAALYLDMALSQIANHASAPATVFTLHVYQYNLEQGKLSGGRSRLHLISLGDAANAKGMPMSGVGNVLLAVLSGQKHVQYKSHPLTIILRECLASFSSNISVITHLSYAQNRTDALTIIQLSSRIHRIRRKKNKYHPGRGGALQFNNNPSNNNNNVGSSSSGLEPSSSEMSADTVIYLGPCPNEETDGEHPPVVLPNLSFNGNQCTVVDVPDNYPKPQVATPTRKISSGSSSTPNSPRVVAPVKAEKYQAAAQLPVQIPVHSTRSPRVEGIHKASHSGHHSPSHHHHHHPRSAPRGMIHADNIVMEQWVDGPKVARSKISEARHLKREVNRNKNSETWIDGPKMEPTKLEPKPQPLPQLPSLVSKQRGYGFMDTHKKTMIRKWVENQTTEVLKISTNSSVTTTTATTEWQGVEEESQSPRRSSSSRTGVGAVGGGGNGMKTPSADEDDQDSGPSDVPPALPLIDKSSKTSEKDYGYTMNDYTATHTVESGGNDPLASHPLSALSYGNMSTVSSFHFEEVRIQNDGQRRNTNDKNMDQLARIRELFTSQLALAEVNRVFHFCTNDNNSIYSEPVHKLLDGGDLDSACSEPMMMLYSHNQNQNHQRPNHPQRPTELGNKLETILPAVSAVMSGNSNLHLDGCGEINGGGGRTGSVLALAASSAAGAAVSNLQDLDLEYPFVVDTRQPAPSSNRGFVLNSEIQEELARIIPQPIVQEPYDSGHDSTPRTSKHSGFSRRAESGYHSISVTVHDESEVSSLKSTTVSTGQAAKRDRRLLCLWLPFNCTQTETEAEVSDF